MKDLITYLARSLATKPEEVSVSQVEGERGNTLELTVADEDLHSLIGKQGRTIKAMRSLLAASANKNGQRYYLVINSSSTALPPDKKDQSRPTIQNQGLAAMVEPKNQASAEPSPMPDSSGEQS